MARLPGGDKPPAPWLDQKSTSFRCLRAPGETIAQWVPPLPIWHRGWRFVIAPHVAVFGRDSPCVITSTRLGPRAPPMTDLMSGLSIRRGQRFQPPGRLNVRDPVQKAPFHFRHHGYAPSNRALMLVSYRGRILCAGISTPALLRHPHWPTQPIAVKKFLHGREPDIVRLDLVAKAGPSQGKFGNRLRRLRIHVNHVGLCALT
jgi:hypothetical protein